MKRPPDHMQYGHGLEICHWNIDTGSNIKYKFYNVGPWKENYIPRELEEKKWIPEDDKMYKFCIDYFQF